jgi:hypothetical protein
VVGSCEYGDEPSGSGATELVSLGKHFMKPSNYGEILLCEILYFIRGTGLLLE